jgi:hypothetical protein
MPILSTIMPLVQGFAPAFTAPTFANFCFLLLSWIGSSGKHTICGLLRAAVPMPPDSPAQVAQNKHWTVFHKFFSTARWDPDTLGMLLARMLEPWLFPGHVLVAVDDTLTRRTGPWLVGGGMHLDQMLSTSTFKYFHFGLNFVVLTIWLPLPAWIPSHTGGMPVPLLFRLYRSKKTCPKKLYKERTELAAEMINLVADWWPERRIEVVGDTEYSCIKLLVALPSKAVLTGRIHPRADLRQPFPAPYKGLPFKLMLFVLVDGWNLVVGMLLASFATG